MCLKGSILPWGVFSPWLLLCSSPIATLTSSCCWRLQPGLLAVSSALLLFQLARGGFELPVCHAKRLGGGHDWEGFVACGPDLAHAGTDLHPCCHKPLLLLLLSIGGAT
jgi:hypothetical protein